MNVLEPISTIMTSNVLTVNPTSKLAEVKNIFDANKIHHLPVVENKEIVGLLSTTDLNAFLRGKSDNNYDQLLNDVRLNQHTADEIMTTGLAKLSSTDRISVALKVFKENLFHAIPVVDDGQLVGIVTTHDIIKMIPNK